MRHHLAVLRSLYLNEILSGRKTIECRFGQIGYPPHDFAHQADLVWLKEVSGPVRAVASAGAVRVVYPLTQHLIDELRHDLNDRIRAPASFWQHRGWATVATLIWLENVCPLVPFTIPKHDRRAWVLLAQPPVPGRPIVAEAWRKASM